MAKQVARFVAIEGMDGTGKTAMVAAIENHARTTRRPLVVTSDPPPEWMRIRREFLEDPALDLGELARATVFLAGRTEATRRDILPALRKGIPVLSDRSVESWFAYQAGALAPIFRSENMALRWLEKLHEHYLKHDTVSQPDVVHMLLDEPEAVMRRLIADQARRGILSRYENLDTQTSVRRIYLKRAAKEPGRIKVHYVQGRPQAEFAAVVIPQVLQDLGI